jgi:hypothetical protein
MLTPMKADGGSVADVLVLLETVAASALATVVKSAGDEAALLRLVAEPLAAPMRLLRGSSGHVAIGSHRGHYWSRRPAAEWASR